MKKTSGHPSRRSFLMASTAGVSALAIGGGKFSFAQGSQVSLESYQPVYFAEAEWAFVKAATARLIPEEGDGPGALSAHVPIFIDQQLAGDFGSAAHWYMDGPHVPDADPLFGFQSPLTPAEIYRVGIVELNAHCRSNFGEDFSGLTPEDQDTVLTRLQSGAIALKGVSGETFFEFLLQNTKEGYFSDPRYGGNHGMQAWVFIGFPGARASYREWVGQHNKPYPLGPVSISGERA